MEEADLLKERLQAITDKRKIQEDIATKRREIEEEKLKLQYLKKKALREQWLMDGLSPQSAQEQEAMKLQVQDNQEQSKVLQSNIHRMEKEIEALEKQETMISANEQIILKRLKEVEKTAEDIIKAVNADIEQEPVQYIYSAIPDIPKSFKPPQLKKLSSPELDPNDEQPKQALFAMEINVQKDMRTGESQVLSTATVTPQQFQQKGVKVYDDGRKSVYALRSDGQVARNGVEELTPVEVEELLRKATEAKPSSDVEYHEPVFSSSYSRPSTPRRPDRDQVSPGPKVQSEALKCPGTAQSEVLQSDRTPPASSHIPHPNANKHMTVEETSPQSIGKTQNNFTNGGKVYLETSPQSPAGLQEPRENHRAALLVESGSRDRSLSPSHRASPNLIGSAVPASLDPAEPVTMIFMGYQKVDDEEETRKAMGYDGAIQAELVVIGDDEDGSDVPLSYHPDGYHSKIFQPRLSSKASQYLTEAKANCNRNNASPQTISDHLSESGQSPFQHGPSPDRQVEDDGTEDPSATALRMRMAKLGKRV